MTDKFRIAFIEYEDEEQAARAKSEMNGFSIEGREISVMVMDTF